MLPYTTDRYTPEQEAAIEQRDWENDCEIAEEIGREREKAMRALMLIRAAEKRQTKKGQDYFNLKLRVLPTPTIDHGPAPLFEADAPPSPALDPATCFSAVGKIWPQVLEEFGEPVIGRVCQAEYREDEWQGEKQLNLTRYEWMHDGYPVEVFKEPDWPETQRPF